MTCQFRNNLKPSLEIGIQPLDVLFSIHLLGKEDNGIINIGRKFISVMLNTKIAALDTDGDNGVNFCLPRQCISLQIHFEYMQFDREKLVIILLLISCVLLWFYLTYLEDTIYTKTFNYDKTEQEVKADKKENMKLKNQLLQSESYTTIAKKAAKEGFVPAVFVTP